MRYLYFFITLLLTLPCLAQENNEIKRFRIGVFGGSNVLGKTFAADKLDWATGLAGGVDVGHYFGGFASGASLHFKPNFTHFKRTWKLGSLDGDFYMERRWRWSALNSPLTFRYSFGLGHIRPFVEGGLNLRMRTSLYFKARDRGCYGQMGDCTTTPVWKAEVDSQVKNDPFGALWGVGVEIDAGKTVIPLSIQMNDGLQPAGGVTSDPSSAYNNLKTKYLQVTAGLVF